MTRTPGEIDQLFEHLVTNLEHQLDEPLHWMFNLAGADRPAMEGMVEQIEAAWAQHVKSVIDDAAAEDAEVGADVVDNVEATENGGETTTSMLSLQVVTALTPEQVKALAEHAGTLAEQRGLALEDIDCTDPMDFDEFMAWLDLDDARWRLAHFTDSGLPEGDPVPFVFAIEASERTTLESVAQALAEAGYEHSEIHADPDDPQDMGLVVHIEGRNDEQVLAKTYQAVASVVQGSGAELLGVQFFAESEEEE
ncbi:MAG: hypothetical protein RIB58_06595 [Phycisphaerales bacterium]|jgi:hypothetical protein